MKRAEYEAEELVFSEAVDALFSRFAALLAPRVCALHEDQDCFKCAEDKESEWVPIMTPEDTMLGDWILAYANTNIRKEETYAMYASRFKTPAYRLRGLLIEAEEMLQ